MKKILSSNRLYLRELSQYDVTNIYKLHNDVDVMRYISTKKTYIINETECLEFISKCQNYYRENEGLGIWATIIKDTDEFIGWTTLKDLDSTSEIELGYRYFKDYWGKGYGTEISLKLVQYGIEVLELDNIVAVALEENKASRRIMEKVGMEYIGKKVFYSTSVSYYKIDNPILK